MALSSDSPSTPVPGSQHTPKSLGYQMPAEWAPHRATWFTWPRPDGISFPGNYEPVPQVYAALFEEITKGEEVHVNVWNDEMERTIRSLLSQRANQATFCHPFPSYEPWCRDHGPIFLTHPHSHTAPRVIVNWGYNAWGDKYPPYDLDNQIPVHVSNLLEIPRFDVPMILEGGSIEVNGQGTLLTTEACLLNPNRNPDLSQSQIEQFLKDYLGVDQILWLGDGIVGDDTDGHIDDLSRFVSAETIVTVVEEDPLDENYELLQDNLKRLHSFRTPSGGRFQIVSLPMPGRVEFQGQRLPASYANFYIANHCVLVPTYRHQNDSKALEILQAHFPDRKVLGIDSTPLIWGLGSFHCISQQEPSPPTRTHP